METLEFKDLDTENQEYIRGMCTPENFYKLMIALLFYGDPDTYHAVMVLGDRPCGEFADDHSEIKFVNDDGEVLYKKEVPGKHARDVLRGVTGIDNLGD